MKEKKKKKQKKKETRKKEKGIREKRALLPSHFYTSSEMELNNLLTTEIQASHLLSPRGETESRAAVNPSPQCEAKETPHQGATQQCPRTVLSPFPTDQNTKSKSSGGEAP